MDVFLLLVTRKKQGDKKKKSCKPKSVTNSFDSVFFLSFFLPSFVRNPIKSGLCRTHTFLMTANNLFLPPNANKISCRDDGMRGRESPFVRPHTIHNSHTHTPPTAPTPND